MNRRGAWIVGGVVAVAILLVGGMWVWQTTDVPTVPQSSSTTTAASAPLSDPTALAQRALDEHLEGCTAEEAAGGAVPEGCGIRIPWGTEFAAVDSVRFRIERMPLLQLSDDGFVADGGILVATVSGTGQDSARLTQTYRTESWTVRGDATVSDGEARLQVW